MLSGGVIRRDRTGGIDFRCGLYRQCLTRRLA
jgi:hypothetical protein